MCLPRAANPLVGANPQRPPITMEGCKRPLVLVESDGHGRNITVTPLGPMHALIIAQALDQSQPPPLRPMQHTLNEQLEQEQTSRPCREVSERRRTPGRRSNRECTRSPLREGHGPCGARSSCERSVSPHDPNCETRSVPPKWWQLLPADMLKASPGLRRRLSCGGPAGPYCGTRKSSYSPHHGVRRGIRPMFHIPT
ncbi:LOW QUALITY PROTEIN: hypothetical protein Cgig2_008897 [Carnegiea gigantea]|uniref:Uncharacterized protein n=1 Tax=Carnegiea gigantea TaxID=171969 RepID=A0A9Q1QLU6_9CARY|nr:LOW QUALITY PROTEIN: hypothetical protein Cgig2_008897 [Carnegiea gigantea]